MLFVLPFSHLWKRPNHHNDRTEPLPLHRYFFFAERILRLVLRFLLDFLRQYKGQTAYVLRVFHLKFLSFWLERYPRLDAPSLLLAILSYEVILRLAILLILCGYPAMVRQT